MTTTPVRPETLDAPSLERATSIARALQARPEVLDAWVDAAGDRSVAHVRLVRLARSGGTDGARGKQHVHGWNRIYEWVYGELEQQDGLGENFVGWQSSFTGEPIPLEQMREWRDATVTRLRGFAPRRVLEIGVGTGLVLGHLAHHVEEYVGLDFSARVIDTLSAQVAADPRLADRVTLHVREADDLDGLPRGHFDTVILNSIVQYFPDADYLARVLTGALELVKPGGRVFVGDVRDLRLLRAMRAAVLASAPPAPSDPPASLLAAAIANEQELLVHPDFFTALAARTPGCAYADVRAKRAEHRNELSGHRYDVTLVAAEHPVPPCDSARRMRWGTDLADLDSLARLLASDDPDDLRVCGVPNTRVAGHIAAAAVLDRGGDLDAAHAALDVDTDAPELHEIIAVAERAGFDATVVFAEDGPAGLLDVVLTPWPADGAVPLTEHRPHGATDGPLDCYTNRPTADAPDNSLDNPLADSLADSLDEGQDPDVTALLAALPDSLRPEIVVIEP